MIDGLSNALNIQQPTTRKVLRMVENERMGGFVPKWETETIPQKSTDEIEHTLNESLNNSEISSSLLAYNADTNIPEPSAEEEFGFSDLIDMINPLHHIPVVGHAYRAITGDEIKPIGQIMGGALFGGPLGATSGLINVVIREETGKDLAGNAMAMAFGGEDVPQISDSPPSDDPEIRLALLDQDPNPSGYAEDLPGNLLSFIDMSKQSEIVIERRPASDGRTAGSFTQHSYPETSPMAAPIREPITQIRFKSQDQ